MPARIEPFYRELGSRIQQARATKKFTQEDVGTRLTPPMTRASVANIETGKQRVLAHTLVQFASVLGVDLGALVPPSNGAADSDPVENAVEAELAEKLPDLHQAKRQAFFAKLKF